MAVAVAVPVDDCAWSYKLRSASSVESDDSEFVVPLRCTCWESYDKSSRYPGNIFDHRMRHCDRCCSLENMCVADDAREVYTRRDYR